MFRKDDRRARRREFRPGVTGLEHRWLQTAVPPGYVARTLATGLEKPTTMVVGPGGRLFVAQQFGQIRVVEGGRVLPTPLLTLRVDGNGERGVVGLALDPKFATSPWLYVYYTVPGPSGGRAHNRVSRFRVSGNVADRSSEQILLELPPLDDEHHNGGSLSFGRDGTLFVGVGDNNHPERAQSLNSPFGKILRINPDGSIPRDNPFYSRTTGINRAIWAYGLRNPFSTAFNPQTGAFYINDVGENDWEEVNIGVRGANYGWPDSEGPTTTPGVRGPHYAYRHGTDPKSVAAITGAAFDSTTRPLVTTGSFYFSDVTGAFIRRLTRTGQVLPFALGLPRLTVDLDIDSAGRLYVLSTGNGGNTGLITMIARRR